ncbi:hypothetical protein PYW07_009641 [Mythimna separata]|uniref:Uncharacterized protein n=1 Tax=Mythimna separata TaxID=271217 RepID=A0AAD7YCP3_MYTSE|nr:hypothetical protein PYW07_009641 [Mythimna separata]
MTDNGFVKAQSDNLPKIDAFMMTTYFALNPDFTSAEVKGVKAARSQRESYGDSAVEYVQIKREHHVRQKSYAVLCNKLYVMKLKKLLFLWNVWIAQHT